MQFLLSIITILDEVIITYENDFFNTLYLWVQIIDKMLL